MKKEQVIQFKSLPKYYEPEEEGKKNNTIRNTKDWDYDKWKEFVFANKIQIKNANDRNELFERTIKHKCVWNGYVIITWKEE